MKHMGLRRLVLVGLAVALMVGLGFAQENLSEKGSRTLKVDLPFPFMVGDTMLQPGKYEIERVAEWDFAVRMMGSSKVLANFATEPSDMAQSPMKGRVVFNIYGDKYFLSNVWFASEAYGYRLPRSKAERALMKLGPTQTQEAPEIK